MSKITVGADGTFNVNFDNIKKITIDHLPDVISHRIFRVDNTVTHEVEFVNGGRCFLAYSNEGKVLGCRIIELNAELNLEKGIIILRPKTLL